MQFQEEEQIKDSLIQGYQLVKILSRGSTSLVYRIKFKKKSNQQQSLKKSCNFTQIHIEDIKKTNNLDKKFIYRFKSQICQNKKEPISQQEIQPIENEVYSLKLYNLKKIQSTSNEQLKKTMRYNILTEFFLYSKLNHQGITKGHKIYAEHKIPTFKTQQNFIVKLQKLGLILQSNSKGNISAFMNYIDRTKILKDNKLKIIKFYAAQLVNSLSYLNQKMHVLHRDVKAENIMINKNFELKIIDFGSAQTTESFLEKIDQNQFSLLKHLVFQQQVLGSQKQSNKKLKQDFLSNRSKQKLLVGSKHYISPQMIENTRNQMFFIQNAYKKTDIWSFGILLYKLFHDRFPFQHKNQKSLLEIIQNQDISFQMDNSLPQQVKQIISKTLKKDYTQRATWNQIKNLSFFQGLDIENIYEYVSPIYELLQNQKKLSQEHLKNYQCVHFEQNMLVQNKDSKKLRKVMIVSQKSNLQNFKINKILILKLNNPISQEIVLQEIKTQFFIQENVFIIHKKNDGLVYRFEEQKRESNKELQQEETLLESKTQVMLEICLKLTKK